jgi:enoyl-CoA hydratase/carnithine racemase
MPVDPSARKPSEDWLGIVRKNGVSEFAAAFAANPVLHTSVMSAPCVGVECIAAFFAAAAGGMYDTLAFAHETVDGPKTLALCESMPKPVIAAISGTCLAGGFEFELSCDPRIAEDGDYLIGLPEVNLGLLPGAGGTQKLPRTIGAAAALMHIFMGDPVAPQEAAKLGLVNETVSGKALDRALEIARRLASRPPEAVGYIKRLIRNATETPLAQGLALERNLFLRLCTSEPALARMRSHEGMKITAPSRSIEVETGSASHD